MRSLLVDPFQRRVHEIDVGDHIRDWYRWCDCDCFDHVQLGEYQDQIQDLWVDDEGLLKEPPYPMWVWLVSKFPEEGINYSPKLCGYGLINASIGPETIATKMPAAYAAVRISWEPWERRLNSEDYFDQLSRIYLQTGTGKTHETRN